MVLLRFLIFNSELKSIIGSFCLYCEICILAPLKIVVPDTNFSIESSGLAMVFD